MIKVEEMPGVKKTGSIKCTSAYITVSAPHRLDATYKHIDALVYKLNDLTEEEIKIVEGTTV